MDNVQKIAKEILAGSLRQPEHTPMWLSTIGKILEKSKIKNLKKIMNTLTNGSKVEVKKILKELETKMERSYWNDLSHATSGYRESIGDKEFKNKDFGIYVK